MLPIESRTKHSLSSLNLQRDNKFTLVFLFRQKAAFKQIERKKQCRQHGPYRGGQCLKCKPNFDDLSVSLTNFEDNESQSLMRNVQRHSTFEDIDSFVISGSEPNLTDSTTFFTQGSHMPNDSDSK